MNNSIGNSRILEEKECLYNSVAQMTRFGGCVFNFWRMQEINLGHVTLEHG